MTAKDAVSGRPSAAAGRMKRAAIEAFAELGFAGTSTRDISRRLGLSAAAMYPHFKSKEELLYAVSLDGHLAALELLSSADTPALPPAARLRAVVEAFVKWQAEQAIWARVVQYELRWLSPEHYRTVLEIRHRTTGVIAVIVDAGCASGEFRVHDEATTTLAVTSLCVDVCRWFPSATHADPAALASRYAELSLQMVGYSGSS